MYGKQKRCKHTADEDIMKYQKRNPDVPTSGFVHATCCNRKVWKDVNHNQAFCKAQVLTGWGACLMIDDNPDILTECESAGVVCWQVCEEADRETGQKRTKPKDVWRSPLFYNGDLGPHDASWSFPDAVEQIIRAGQGEQLWNKIGAALENIDQDWRAYRNAYGVHPPRRW